MVKINVKSAEFKALRAAIYAGVSSALAFLALQVGADGSFTLDRTLFVSLFGAFINGVAVWVKNKFD